jgi:hypothetical protein
MQIHVPAPLGRSFRQALRGLESEMGHAAVSDTGTLPVN